VKILYEPPQAEGENLEAQDMLADLKSQDMALSLKLTDPENQRMSFG